MDRSVSALPRNILQDIETFKDRGTDRQDLALPCLGMRLPELL